MKLLEAAIKLLRGEEPQAPEGYCPNCWGHQKYAGEFLERMKKERVDLNNADQKKGWIQAYALKHFEGIRKEPSEACPVCSK